MLFNCKFSEHFLRFKIFDSPIHLDRTWSCLSCPEVLQIWRPSERTFLERDFGSVCNLKLCCHIICHLVALATMYFITLCFSVFFQG